MVPLQELLGEVETAEENSINQTFFLRLRQSGHFFILIMYYRCIRTCPTLWILLTFGISFALFGYALYKHSLPSFDDPLIGFEVRNSRLSSRLNTWRLLSESTAWNGLLSLYPKPPEETEQTATTTTTTTITTTSQLSQKTKKSKLRAGKFRNGTRRVKPARTEDYSQLDNVDPFNSKSHVSNSFFCGKVLEDYVHFVVETNDHSNLLELQSLQNTCNLDKFALRMNEVTYDNLSVNLTSSTNESGPSTELPHFRNYCETKNHDQCCPSWSLPNFILLMSNKTNDCSSITNSDIDAFVKLLQECSVFYADRYLNEDCGTVSGQCPNVPEQCYAYENLVFNVFHYLVDYRFFGIHQHIVTNQNNISLPSDDISKPKRLFLTSSSIFLPMAKSSKLLAYYESITNPEKTLNHSTGGLSFGNVHIVAADLGLKHTLFSQSLVSDLMLLIISSCIIFSSLLLYTRSFLLTLTALLTNISSLGTAYFIYTCLLGITFFPFLNLLSLIILIGIGSDNALIYCKAWSCVASQKTGSNRRRQEYHNLLSATLRHVLVSTFCASLTTCCAFFAGYFTEITSLKCFSIFAGISIVTNFLITVITFPSSILLSEKLGSCGLLFSMFKSHQKLYIRMECFANNVSQFIFHKVILKLVFNYRYLLAVFFSSIALTSGVLVFYSPGFQLPTSQEFQVFSSKHLFERYDLKYKNEFWYSRFVDRESVTKSSDTGGTALSVSNVVLPIRIVFGVFPIDNGDALNPFNRGKLEFDPDFNISCPESQVWLLDFCRDLRTQPFYRPVMGPLLTNCFIETFKAWMDDRRCIQVLGSETEDRFPCCEQSKFPYEPHIFNQCLVEVTERLHKTPNYMFAMNRAGPRFDVKNIGTVKAVVIEYDSVFDAFATSFQEMDKLWDTIDGWVQEQLKTAPKGLQSSGWFVTVNAEFYALQQSLSSGVLRSVLISVGFAFLTLVVTTWNIRLSVLSTLSIAFLIFTTIATLIILDWRLNIIESIAISLTIGLAIDATLHYTIAYKLLAKGNRLLGIQMTLARIGSPVAMGAITTFLAGSVMLLSYILAYIQIGTFMMLLSVISWLYSTLFHLSLLSIFGAHHEKSTILSTICNPLRSVCFWKRRTVICKTNVEQCTFHDGKAADPQQTSHMASFQRAQIIEAQSNYSTNSVEQDQVLLEHRRLHCLAPSDQQNNELRHQSDVCLRVTSI